jgi:hypothetical protein
MVATTQTSWLQIVPGLKHVGEIMTACDVSKSYASMVRNGMRRPHPRHWPKLVELIEPSRDSM